MIVTPAGYHPITDDPLWKGTIMQIEEPPDTTEPPDEPTGLASRQSSVGLSIDVIQRYARGFVMSGLFKTVGGDRGLAQAFVKIQAGQELGIPPFAAMRGLNVMDGKVELAAGLMAALVKRSDRDYVIVESTEETCTLEWMKREEGWRSPPMKLGSSTFTIAEAKRAGLVKAGSAWANYPSDMLFNRALSRGFRRFCPDLSAGAPIYIEGEVVDVIEAREMTGADIPAHDADTGEIAPAADPPDDAAADGPAPEEPEDLVTLETITELSRECARTGVKATQIAEHYQARDLAHLTQTQALDAIARLTERDTQATLL